jgi:hypothetical protein
MSLLTDSNHVTESDLAALDPEISAIAAAEEVNVDTLLGQAWIESATRIQELTQPRYGQFQDPVLAYHTNLTPEPVQLSSIVVTSEYAGHQSALKRWMVWMAMATFYRAIANRRDEDRYQRKQERAEKEAERGWSSLFSVGLPVVLAPLPCPGAVHEIGAGVFGSSSVTSVSGGTTAAGDYEVSITWMDADGVESGPSASVPVTVPVNDLIRVSISGLGAPGVVSVARPTDMYYPTLTATHWNVYVGAAGGPQYKQNSSPIAISSTTYTLADDPVLSGTMLGTGQVANSTHQFSRIVGRG